MPRAHFEIKTKGGFVPDFFSLCVYIMLKNAKFLTGVCKKLRSAMQGMCGQKSRSFCQSAQGSVQK